MTTDQRGKVATLKAGQEIILGDESRRIVIERIQGSRVRVRIIAPEYVRVRTTRETTK